MRDVDTQFAAAHPGADVQAQGWLDQVQAANPAGYDHMPLFQATTQDRNDPTKYAGTKLTSPDVYAVANRPAIPGTLSPTSPSLSAIATGNLKALGNLGIDLYNRSLDIAVGDAGKNGQLPQFKLTPDESAAAQATGIMALPFGAEDIGGLFSTKGGSGERAGSIEAGSQGTAVNTSSGQIPAAGPAQNASGDLNAAGNAARNQPHGNGASASPSPGANAAGNSGASVGLPSATNAPSALQQATDLFSSSGSGKLQIGGSTFSKLPNNGNAAIFSGATDEQVQQYFLQLSGASSLPDAVPLTIRGVSGVRYTIETPSGNFTLRSVSSSQSQTGPAWTVEVPSEAIGTSANKEIKFLRGTSQ